MAERKGVVIDLTSARGRKAKGFRERSTAGEGRLENELSAEACIAVLEEKVNAKMSGGLKVLLEMPPKLHSVGAEPGMSFSSNPGKSIAGVFGHIFNDMGFPAELPDYGIHLSSRGSNAFCTLLDRSRKIIVCQDVQNMFANQGSWVSFENALKDALHAADSFRADKKDFSFVICRDGIIRSI